MGLYLHLFHGRRTPTETLDDWGFEGPALGPLDYVHTTYAHDVKLGFQTHAATQAFTLGSLGGTVGNETDTSLPVSDDDLLLYDGHYFGDWSACLFTEEEAAAINARWQAFRAARRVEDEPEEEEDGDRMARAPLHCEVCGVIYARDVTHVCRTTLPPTPGLGTEEDDPDEAGGITGPPEAEVKCGGCENTYYTTTNAPCPYCGRTPGAPDDDCDACEGKGWLVMDNDRHGLQIERCDNCARFADDDAVQAIPEARAALQAALTARPGRHPKYRAHWTVHYRPQQFRPLACRYRGELGGSPTLPIHVVSDRWADVTCPTCWQADPLGDRDE